MSKGRRDIFICDVIMVVSVITGYFAYTKNQYIDLGYCAAILIHTAVFVFTKKRSKKNYI